ncbi:hypothetical protein SCP_0903680 [Sparassis crispa]|uniref:Uncharacterized protein n=1 Tax=Sparassis crispa TaxID=139825 RepID=A0A401GWE6_9APHY|nr:hypothetical protein SCP_0903680 [Sparassis crispa]GBE86489.1 hypothetical protein SCP_0903680 [Sparassis crispa]
MNGLQDELERKRELNLEFKTITSALEVLTHVSGEAPNSSSDLAGKSLKQHDEVISMVVDAEMSMAVGEHLPKFYASPDSVAADTVMPTSYKVATDGLGPIIPGDDINFISREDYAEVVDICDVVNTPSNTTKDAVSPWENPSYVGPRYLAAPNSRNTRVKPSGVRRGNVARCAMTYPFQDNEDCEILKAEISPDTFQDIRKDPILYVVNCCHNQTFQDHCGVIVSFLNDFFKYSMQNRRSLADKDMDGLNKDEWITSTKFRKYVYASSGIKMKHRMFSFPSDAFFNSLFNPNILQGLSKPTDSCPTKLTRADRQLLIRLDGMLKELSDVEQSAKSVAESLQAGALSRSGKFVAYWQKHFTSSGTPLISSKATSEAVSSMPTSIGIASKVSPAVPPSSILEEAEAEIAKLPLRSQVQPMAETVAEGLCNIVKPAEDDLYDLIKPIHIDNHINAVEKLHRAVTVVLQSSDTIHAFTYSDFIDDYLDAIWETLEDNLSKCRVQRRSEGSATSSQAEPAEEVPDVNLDTNVLLSRDLPTKDAFKKWLHLLTLYTESILVIKLSLIRLQGKSIPVKDPKISLMSINVVTWKQPNSSMMNLKNVLEKLLDNEGRLQADDKKFYSMDQLVTFVNDAFTTMQADRMNNRKKLPLQSTNKDEGLRGSTEFDMRFKGRVHCEGALGSLLFPPSDFQDYNS